MQYDKSQKKDNVAGPPQPRITGRVRARAKFKVPAHLLGLGHCLQGCCLSASPFQCTATTCAGHLKNFDKIPGPAGLPFVGNLLSFASFRPRAHLVWAEWANRFGGIYR